MCSRRSFSSPSSAPGNEGKCICERTNLQIHHSFTYINIISSFPGAHDVWFVLNGTTYQNNSIVILEDIGEGDDALDCITNQTACCRPPYTDEIGQKALGNWYFPNGTRVPSSGHQWDFHRTRGHMMVRMQRRRGGAEGIYRCAIPDTFGFIQNIYIGVYSANTGELLMYTAVILQCPDPTSSRASLKIHS